MTDEADRTDNGSGAATGRGGGSGPLSDLRVLDLTRMLSGPFATMVLADLGADVVKVESPAGDLTRSNPPHLRSGEAYGGYFNSVNRNKRSIVMDLKSDGGRETFLELVREADVVVENYRAGTMERFDLSYERLAEENDRLVYASIRGFGDPRTGASPYADRPTFDLIAQAMGGIMSVTGTDAAGPTKVGPGVGDIFPAVLSVVGILSALRHRDRTGEGQYVDVGMVDSVLALCERIVHQYSVGGEVPGPQGNSHPLIFPYDRFETADGYLVIAAPADHQWRALCKHMDRPDLVANYPDEADRRAGAAELRPVINGWTRDHTKDELFERMANDVPCGPVNDVADIFEDEHFAAREMLAPVEHADTGETVRIAANPIKFTKTPASVERRAPLLGEHTREILANLGYGDGEIATLLADDAVQDREG